LITTDSILKNKNVLGNMDQSINDISFATNRSNSIFQEQVAILEEISASMEELNMTIKTVEDLSEKI
jgi:methyl-accepting chemotaxis protein